MLSLPQERHEVPGAKDGEASVVLKCPLCARVNSLGMDGQAVPHVISGSQTSSNSADILDDTVAEYTAEHSGQFHKIVSFDCRGVEPFDFDPRVCNMRILDCGHPGRDAD
jgi:hypothetical protein